MGFIDISGESVELTEVDKVRVVDKDGWMSEYENIRSLSYDKDYEEVDIILNGDTDMIVHEGVVHLYLETEGTDYIEGLRKAGTLNSVEEFVRNNRGIDDTIEIHKYICKCSPREVLDMYLEWEGILGYTDRIFNMVSSISREEV